MFVYIIYSLFKGTHDLQGITVWNTSDDVLCLQFKFVHGRQITELHLDMRNNDKHYNLIVFDYICHLIDNDNIYCNNQLTFTKYFSDIPPGNNWTLYVCDGVLPNVSDTCSNPAVILTDITITGRVSIEPSRTSTVISTTITDSISEVPTNTGNDLHYIMYYC